MVNWSASAEAIIQSKTSLVAGASDSERDGNWFAFRLRYLPPVDRVVMLESFLRGVSLTHHLGLEKVWKSLWRTLCIILFAPLAAIDSIDYPNANRDPQVWHFFASLTGGPPPTNTIGVTWLELCCLCLFILRGCCCCWLLAGTRPPDERN